MGARPFFAVRMTKAPILNSPEAPRRHAPAGGPGKVRKSARQTPLVRKTIPSQLVGGRSRVTRPVRLVTFSSGRFHPGVTHLPCCPANEQLQHQRRRLLFTARATGVPLDLARLRNVHGITDEAPRAPHRMRAGSGPKVVVRDGSVSSCPGRGSFRAWPPGVRCPSGARDWRRARRFRASPIRGGRGSCLGQWRPS